MPHILSEIKRDESTSTYTDNGIAYSCFHLFLEKKETYFVLNRLFLKVGA